MTVEKALFNASKTISPLGAEVLLAFLLKKDRTWLYKNPNDKLSPAQEKQFQKLIQKRKKGEPIAYITRHKEFYGLDFYVDERVLIPRPETEILVEEVINEIKNSNLNHKSQIRIADVGTGSGCIAISLAKNLPNIKTYATDISEKALEVAETNAQKHGVSKKIRFLAGNLLSPLPERVDIIIANLPYVNPKFFDQATSEPKMALYGGKEGLEIIKKLLEQAPNYLNKNGKIFLEIDPRQKIQLEELVKKYLTQYAINFEKDLSNLFRVAVIELF